MIDESVSHVTANDDEVGTLSVILLAAGQSTRMGGQDKTVLQLAGRPIIAYSLQVFEQCDLVAQIVIVTHSSRVDEMRELVAGSALTKRVSVVAGGDRRQDSVKQGIEELERLGEQTPFIAVHDAARPFLDAEMLLKGVETARHIGAAIPVVPLKDTVKRVEHSLVSETPNRSVLFAVQTPQVFRTEILRAVHESVEGEVTDDASMVEIAGGLVATFEGSYDNIKLTTPSDIAVAEAIAQSRTDTGGHKTEYRSGIGFDGHRLVPGGPLRLGSVDIEFDMELAGHSDGDVLMHVIASAVLGAAGLGDMGSNFPSSDPVFAGKDSRFFVREAVARAASSGWRIDHIDATVIAQLPRLASHVPHFEQNVADALGVDSERVNVKITSTDHVGAIGQGEGIAAQAIATLVR